MGGSQWIEFKVDSLESKVVACKKESSMAGANVLPAFTNEPATIKNFLQHLDKCGKTQYNIIAHKVARDEIGQVTEITPEDITCLPLPTTTPPKKKYTLENIAGYIDIDAIKESKFLQIMHIHIRRAQNIQITHTHLQSTEQKYYRHTYIHLHT